MPRRKAMAGEQKQKRLHFSLDPDVKADLAKISSTEDRSMGKTANRLLRWAIHEHPLFRQPEERDKGRNPFPL